MKKIIFLSVIFTALFAMQIKAQTYNVGGTYGNIWANGVDYQKSMTITWNINMGVNKPVMIECNMDLMDAWDYFYIYSVDNDNTTTLIATFTSTVYGEIISTKIPNGKAKVVFKTNNICSGYDFGYFGLESYYYPDYSYTFNDVSSYNTVLGNNAGIYTADGTTVNAQATNSVFLGANTKAQANNQTNQIVIGYNAIGNGSNTVTIGNDQITKTVLKGTVSAKEIQIENPVLPDYVFSPDYNLMPLGEIENYIKQNNHLPNIPSAAETANKGMSIGEMQNLLLQKIEELTLYIIQQNKKIQELEEKLKDKE